jgi:hypothetical protein
MGLSIRNDLLALLARVPERHIEMLPGTEPCFKAISAVQRQAADVSFRRKPDRRCAIKPIPQGGERRVIKW